MHHREVRQSLRRRPGEPLAVGFSLARPQRQAGPAERADLFAKAKCIQRCEPVAEQRQPRADGTDLGCALIDDNLGPFLL